VSNPEAPLRVPNDQNDYEVTKADLPLHCPLPGTTLWNSHPRVFIAVEETGEGQCSYCGARYRLVSTTRE
jgi:uncharacterized Zn-finger protein